MLAAPLPSRFTEAADPRLAGVAHALGAPSLGHAVLHPSSGHGRDEPIVLLAVTHREAQVTAQRVGRPEGARHDASAQQLLRRCLCDLVVPDAHEQEVRDARVGRQADGCQSCGQPVALGSQRRGVVDRQLRAA